MTCMQEVRNLNLRDFRGSMGMVAFDSHSHSWFLAAIFPAANTIVTFILYLTRVTRHFCFVLSCFFVLFARPNLVSAEIA